MLPKYFLLKSWHLTIHKRWYNTNSTHHSDMALMLPNYKLQEYCS